MHIPKGYFSVSNASRWQQLRELMIRLEEQPQFRLKCLSNGYISPWDTEWFYHFSDDGYVFAEWFELRGPVLRNPQLSSDIADIQFVGSWNEDILRLYGYLKNGQSAVKLRAI